MSPGRNALTHYCVTACRTRTWYPHLLHPGGLFESVLYQLNPLFYRTSACCTLWTRGIEVVLRE